MSPPPPQREGRGLILPKVLGTHRRPSLSSCSSHPLLKAIGDESATCLSQSGEANPPTEIFPATGPLSQLPQPAGSCPNSGERVGLLAIWAQFLGGKINNKKT